MWERRKTNILKQVLPKVIWEERVATPHGRECTRLLCASCAMSTADKSSYSAAGTLHPYHISPLTHQSLTITFTITLTLLAVLVPLQPPAISTRLNVAVGHGRVGLVLLDYINPQSSHSNNVKITIACNSAFCLRRNINFKFHLRLASRYCVFQCQMPKY